MGKTCDLGNFEHDMIADAGRVSSSSRGIFLYILKFANFGSINIQLVADLWIKTHKTDESSKGQQQLEKKKKKGHFRTHNLMNFDKKMLQQPVTMLSGVRLLPMQSEFGLSIMNPVSVLWASTSDLIECFTCLLMIYLFATSTYFFALIAQ